MAHDLANDVVALLRHHYCVDGTPDTHPIRRAIAEILRLREEAERMRLLAVEAQRSAYANRRDAERYRWIRTAGAWESEMGMMSLSEDPAARFDAAVDERMAERENAR